MKACSGALFSCNLGKTKATPTSGIARDGAN
jgi:hypothetical protein